MTGAFTNPRVKDCAKAAKTPRAPRKSSMGISPVPSGTRHGRDAGRVRISVYELLTWRIAEKGLTFVTRASSPCVRSIVGKSHSFQVQRLKHGLEARVTNEIPFVRKSAQSRNARAISCFPLGALCFLAALAQIRKGYCWTCLLAVLAMQAVALAAPVPQRSVKVVVSHDAPAEVKDAAAAVVAAAKTNPLLKLFAGDKPVETVESEKLLAAAPADRAYSHLVLVGLTNDPIIQRAWQHEAQPSAQGIYVFGFGQFTGDLGYIESDRNPFLHAADIKAAPFETEIVTITGTTPAGVTAAARAFIQQGLVNGVVAAGKWTRSEPGLLDRDPLAENFTVPTILPEQVGKLTRIGITQASEDEYRGVLQDTGIEPLEIWRAKYYVPGAWDGAGAAAAFKAYHTGLHRRATGNTLWAARFDSPEHATQAAEKIAGAASLHRRGSDDPYLGQQPPFSSNDSPGPLALWCKGEWVLMSTLPKDATDVARK
jgi:hypothetical protein